MPRWGRLVHALGFAALAACYVAFPDPPRWLWAVLGLSSVAATVVGVGSNRPRTRSAWYLVAAGIGTLIAGDITYDLLTHVFGYANPFPSLADVFYLFTYPLLVAGLLLMVRARSVGGDRAALLDALIVTLGLGLLTWVFLMKPYVHDQAMSWLEKAVSLGYPLGDILLLAVLTRLLVGGGSRSPAVRLLTVGAVGLLVSDVLYGLSQLGGAWQTGGFVDVGWIIFYGAMGAAALQPDMVTLAEPVRGATTGLSRPRLVLLAVVSLIAPVLILIEAPVGSFLDLAVVAVASGAMFLLVTARLDGIVYLARESAQREYVLRRTGERLVAASGREDIYLATAEAVLEVLGHGGASARVLLAVDGGTGHSWVHDSGGAEQPATDGRLVGRDAAGFLARHSAKLHEHQFVLTDSDNAGLDLASALGPGVPLVIAALAGEDALAGVLVVAGRDVGRADVVDAVCALATQTALALESVTLTEQVVRRRNEAHFRSLIQNASDVILVVDDDLRVIYQTPSVHAVLGMRAEEIDGRPVTDLVVAEDAGHAALVLRRAATAARTDAQVPASFSAEWRMRHADGRLRIAEVTGRNLLDDQTVNGLVLTLHDITDRRALEDELKHLAFHDLLTQLPNRALFVDRVEHALRRQGRHRERLGLLLIDLDDFKVINDTRGHAAGDALLVAVADRLRGCLRDEDTATRLGGDEFAVFVEGLIDDEEAQQLAQRILDALRAPYRIDGEELSVRASIGVATSEYGVAAADLLRQADLAMYAAKDAGKGTHELFQAAMLHRLESRVEWRRDLERGLERGEFRLHYQPVYALDTNAILGAEALLRWQHPEKGLVLPGEFIGVVEETDLAEPLGNWVLDEAIGQAARWNHAETGGARLRMSINVAPRQLKNPSFPAVVDAALRRHGLPADALTLEMTERMLAGEDTHIADVMSALRDLGVGLALDDFGTGYSALGYLRRFPVSTLKVDRSFVAGIESSVDDHALVEAIVRLAETFGLDVVAEGVETPQQRDALLGLGCDRGQGFLMSRPLSGAQLTELLDARRGVESIARPIAAVVPLGKELSA